MTQTHKGFLYLVIMSVILGGILSYFVDSSFLAATVSFWLGFATLAISNSYHKRMSDDRKNASITPIKNHCPMHGFDHQQLCTWCKFVSKL